METSKTSASQNLRQWMIDHTLISFVAMTYAFSWIFITPYILWEWHVLSGRWEWIFTVKAYAGPFLAAYIMTRLLEGREGSRNFWRKIWQWREGWQWYAFIFLVFPALYFLGLAFIPDALANFPSFTTRELISILPTFALVMFGGGPFQEEPGWRGFLLPRLLTRYQASRYPALKASLLVGVIWTFWHLPDFLTSQQHGGPEAGLQPFYAHLPIFFVMVTLVSLIFTWLYNRTHGSVFIAILLHTVVNVLDVIITRRFSLPAVSESELPRLIVWGGLALLILILTRGKLGYEPQ
jgi:uncharacterized protein